jgi:hypothetical protein
MQKILWLIFFLLSLTASDAQIRPIPSPKEYFGFNIGDDYRLVNYNQTEAYFKQIAAGSDRVKLVNMGLTEEGRNQYMMIISSPANIAGLDHYKEISARLAHAEDLTDEQAKTLAEEGKAVIWIDGGIHADESETAQQLIETVWQLASRSDPETMKILDNVIVLCAHANPDGQELVANWYMRDSIPEKRKLGGRPRLYIKYAGHDDNRDYFAFNLRETRNVARQLFIDWLPLIVYNHHQAVSGEAVVSGPPYTDPFNYVIDPLVITGIDALGTAMATRLDREDKPGYVHSTNASGFSTWYNGSLRTSTYFHNAIGLLTEIKGNPSPEEIPFQAEEMVPSLANANPVRPGKMHFREFIDYSLSLNYAVLSYGSNNREALLYNRYKMSRNSIERGQRDYWSLAPKKAAAIADVLRAIQRLPDSVKKSKGDLERDAYDSVMKDPALRDPRGYILSAGQPDFPNTICFVNTLILSGIKVQKATAAFTVAGKKYPAGSYIVKTDQAFRPEILDMFEPQDYPNRLQYPGGPPIAPYDLAGWTLAFQMGVRFDRILDAFDGPFSVIPYGEVETHAGAVVKTGKKVAGYLLNAAVNNAYAGVNDLLAAGIEVDRIGDSVRGMRVSKGSFYIPASGRAAAALEKIRAGLGVDVIEMSRKLAGLKLRSLRIGVIDGYGGSTTAGWCEYVLDSFHFSYTILPMRIVDSGHLRSRFDVIICADEAQYTGRAPEGVPKEYKWMVGAYSDAKSLPALKEFVQGGGSLLVTVGATDFVYKLGVPVRNALVEIVNNKEQPIALDQCFIPGSVLQLHVNTAEPAAWGMDSLADLSFNSDRVFRIMPGAGNKVRPILYFGEGNPLRSGWVLGDRYLQDGVSAFVAEVGKGRVYAFGSDITFRGQTAGVYKLLFNELYGSGGE